MVIVGLLLMLLGGVSLIGAGITFWVRNQLGSYLSAVPQGLHGLLSENLPEMKKATDLSARLPRLSWILCLAGSMLFLLGVTVLPSVVLRLFALLIAGGAVLAARPIGRRFAPLLQTKLAPILQKRALSLLGVRE